MNEKYDGWAIKNLRTGIIRPKSFHIRHEYTMAWYRRFIFPKAKRTKNLMNQIVKVRLMEVEIDG